VADPVFPVAGPLSPEEFLYLAGDPQKLRPVAVPPIAFETKPVLSALDASSLETLGYDDPALIEAARAEFGLDEGAYVPVEPDPPAPAKTPLALQPPTPASPPEAPMMSGFDAVPATSIQASSVPLTWEPSTLRGRIVRGVNPNAPKPEPVKAEPAKKVEPPKQEAPKPAIKVEAPKPEAKPETAKPAAAAKTAPQAPPVKQGIRPSQPAITVRPPAAQEAKLAAKPEPPKVEVKQAEAKPVESKAVETKQPEPRKEAAKPEPPKVETPKPEPAKVEAAKSEPAKPAPKPDQKVEPPKPEPSKPEPSKQEAAKSEPKPEPVKPAETQKNAEKPKINVRPAPTPAPSNPKREEAPAKETARPNAPTRPAIAARSGNALKIEKEQPEIAPPPPAPKGKVVAMPKADTVTDAPPKSIEASVPKMGELTPEGQSPLAKYGAIAAIVVVLLGGGAWFLSSGSGSSTTGTATTAESTVDETPSGTVIGGGGWTSSWGTTVSVNKGKQISIYRPTTQLADYRMEFRGQIEKKALGWIFRAKDPENYYVGKLEIIRPGKQPVVALVKYSVIDGKESTRTQVMLGSGFTMDEVYRVRVDVKGNKFTTYVQDKLVDYWTDDRLRLGGAGFYNDRGERAAVKTSQFAHLK
jgi:hypothetical protein